MKAKYSAVGIIIALALLFILASRCYAEVSVPSTDDFEGPGAKWNWVSVTDAGLAFPELAYVPGDYDANVPDIAKILGWWGEQCLKVSTDRVYAHESFTPSQWAVVMSYDLYLERVVEFNGGMLSAYSHMGSSNPIVMRLTYVTTDTIKLALEVGLTTDEVLLKANVPYHISVAADAIARHWSWSINGGMEGYGDYQPMVNPHRTSPTQFDSVMYIFWGSDQAVYLDNISVLPAKAGYGFYLPIIQGE